MGEEREIPKGWKVATLGEVGEIASGGTPSTFIPEYWNGEISWIAPSDLSGYFDKYISRGAKSISKAGLIKSSARLMPKGTVLFSSRAPIGYVAIADTELCTSQGFKSVIPNKAMSKEYLYYFLKSSKRRAEDVASGTTFKEISLSNFANLDIPLPPIPEQHRIVAKIEELFSSLDKGIESLNTAQQQLKVYRQAVLKWAFEGKLTNKDVVDGKLPKGWKIVKLGAAANAIDPQPSHRTPSVVQDGIPFVSIKDFDPASGKIDFMNARKVSTDVLNEHLERYQLRLGDFVIGKIGTIGKPVRVVLPQNYSLSANIVLIQPLKIDTVYLFYFFQSSLIEKEFLLGMKATTQAAFGIQKVRKLNIHLPQEREQRAIVAEIESRLSVCDKIEESIDHSLKQAESLRQSILKKAFEGKLVPQDPKDEPASLLLARIKAEREWNKPKTPLRRQAGKPKTKKAAS